MSVATFAANRACPVKPGRSQSGLPPAYFWQSGLRQGPLWFRLGAGPCLARDSKPWKARIHWAMRPPVIIAATGLVS